MKSATSGLPLKLWIRLSLGLIAAGTLSLIYIFQRVNVAEALGPDFHPNFVFVINRTVRLVFNDLACLLLIYVLFQEKKYLKLSFWVFLTELLVILPVYLVIKLSLEGDSEISSPLLSQVHRLIVNPMLMFLLIAGFFYQQLKK